MISVYLWFDYWTLKEWKTAKVHNYSVSAWQLFTQMTGPYKFWHIHCCHVYFFPARFLNMCKLRTTFFLPWRAGPPGLAFYGNRPARLPSWLRMLNASWPCSMRSGKWNLSFFKAVPPNRLSFFLGSPLHIISSLFSQFCLCQSAIYYKMLRAGFWNFKPIFLRIQFSLVATFFSLVFVMCMSWYFHLKLSQVFLTFISFSNWR